MARTQEEIEAQIIQAKNAEPELAALDSVSQTAIWRLWVKITAFAFNVLEQLFDIFRSEVDATIAANLPGTLSFYARKAREFQLGSPLNALGEYDVIDPALRIVTRAGVSENNITSGVVLKIAKSEPPVPLSSPEFLLFQGYIEEVKFAGVAINYINLPADVLEASIEVFYSGTLEQVTKEAVEAAIQAYVDGLDFNSRFVVNDCVVAIRQVAGVRNVLVNSFSVGSTNITIDFEAASGYFEFDVAGSSINMTLV